MSVEGSSVAVPDKRRLVKISVIAFVIAVVLLVLVVLPAEFHVDPTGFGAATGLTKLSAPKEQVVAAPTSTAGASPAALFYESAMRTHTIKIPLAASGDMQRGDELEYKVAMKKGATIVYSWTVDGITVPEEFYFDFHSESRPDPEVKVVEFKQETGTSSKGMLVAPFDGVHGWYLQNQSVKPVVVTLEVSGFYDLVPPGETGNLAGIEPVAAAQ